MKIAGANPATATKHEAIMAISSKMVEKHLLHYKPEDGEYVEHVVLIKTFPFLPKEFWTSCLLGCGVGGQTVQVKRLPLRGRLRFLGGKPRVVILVSSLREWFLHYNPGRESTADQIIAGLIRRTKRYEEYLRALRMERMIKSGVGPGQKRQPKKPEPTKIKGVDWSLARVW